VTSADEAIEAMDRVGDAMGGGPRRPPSEAAADLPFGVPAARSPRDRPSREDLARDALDREAAIVLDALPMRGGLSTSDIAVRAGLEPKTVLARLAVLAVFGLAERTERGWRARPAGNATALGTATIRLKHAPGWSSLALLGGD
jgi:hypothetical protein